MSRLNAAQQALVIEHIPNTWAWAARFGSGLSLDEKRSIAYEALCEAAAQLPHARSFSAFAKCCVRRRLGLESNKAATWRRWNPESTDGNIDIAAPDSEAAAIENRELANILYGRFHLLSTKERRILDLYCGGFSWADVKRELRCTSATVAYYQQRIRAKLLASKAR